MLVDNIERKQGNMVCGKLEIDVLNSIWKLTSDDDSRDISIQDVVADLSSNGVERAYTTIKTVMDRLTGKSILVRYKSGKKFFYSAAADREELARDSIADVAKQFFESDYAALIRFVEKKFDLVK